MKKEIEQIMEIIQMMAELKADRDKWKELYEREVERNKRETFKKRIGKDLQKTI